MECATSFNVTETGAELVSDLVVSGAVSVVLVFEFVSFSSVESEPQADNSPTVMTEARSTEISFFFISPPR